ncbi:MAG TPA: hypothetical protein VID19_11930 [Candidatus Eremiobacteraceae bacterium]
MTSFQGLVLRVAAVLVGSTVMGASIASVPAAAQDFNKVVQIFGTTLCSNSTFCKAFKNSGSGAGVEGVASNGSGVIAQSTNGSGTYSTSTNSPGVQSYSTNNDGVNSGTNNNSMINSPRSGVWGHDDSGDGGALNFGVVGSSIHGTGVRGSSANAQFSVGVEAYGGGANFQGDGVETFTPALSVVGYPEDFYGNTVGDEIDVCNSASGVDPCYSQYGLSSFQPDMQMQVGGYLNIVGTLTTGGTCNVGCAGPKGGTAHRVRFYTAQQSEPTVEDMGETQMVNGSAYVPLDHKFANAVDARAHYLVFITPNGDTRGLYVSRKTSAGFEVRETQGGHGSLSFDYRIVAKPYGVTAQRFAMMTVGKPLKPLVRH